jgi:hypothetical protein
MNNQPQRAPRPRAPNTVCSLLPGPCPCSWPCQIALDNAARRDEIKAMLEAAYRGETLNA